MNPSVCFVSLRSYAILTGDAAIQHVGGAEVQQVLLGRGLVERGHLVSFIVHDHGQMDGLRVDGIRLFKAYRPGAGPRFVRFLHPRLTGVVSAMARADAQVYYQRGAEAETGLVASWCRHAERRFVFGAASDTNFLPDLPLVPSRVDRWLYVYGLRRADAVAVQTRKQQRMLWDWQKLPGDVVGNACAVPAMPDEELPSRDRVLWIGRYHECKRPEWLVQLARDFPSVKFMVVGASNAGTAFERRITDQLKGMPNVTLHGYVPYAEMDSYYRKAGLLLCTSSEEGFPNTLLEAWARAVPVLTTFDPDGVVTDHGLGRYAEGLVALRDALGSLTLQPQHWKEAGLRARRYVAEHHSVRVTAEALGGVLERVCARSPDPPRAGNERRRKTA